MASSRSEKFDLAGFLTRRRSQIIETWVERLSTGVRQYSKRPIEELKNTITGAVDANFQVLINEDFEPINRFIDKITTLRLEAGFSLSDVQKAFEFYRIILMDLLLESRMKKPDIRRAVKKTNQCLAYTTHRFSDHFQAMHEKEIRKQNKSLEQMVRKRTAALEESEKKYKTLVEEIDDGYFVLQDEIIVFANQAFCHMHGCRIDNVLGKGFTDFVAERDRELVLKIYTEPHGNDAATQVFEYHRVDGSGEEFPTEIHGKTITFDGKISNIGICRDITDRVRMSKKIRENERMVYIGQIAASLSHEIRNPMSSVKMNLQILKKNEKITGHDLRRVDISLSEVIRLEKILNELLDFAKPLRLHKSYFDMRALISNYIELLDMKFREKDLTVKTVFDTDRSEIWADQEKIGQAVINILINAIEASASSSPITVRYELKTKGRTGFASIVIDDEGCGFDEKIEKNMFKPFFTTKSKGVGLGLSNVKRIIDAHNGAVFVESRKPKGTSFSLMIPTKITPQKPAEA